jgi:hypothetical protein
MSFGLRGWFVVACSTCVVCCGGRAQDAESAAGTEPAGSGGAAAAGGTSRTILPSGGSAGAACLSVGSCLAGTEWSSLECQCVPVTPAEDAGTADAGTPVVDGGSCRFIPCPAYDHWDESSCSCLHDADQCSTATDCKSGLPASCRLCADGSNGCAHFVCYVGFCQIADCGAVAAFTVGQACGPMATYPNCPMMIPCNFDDRGTMGHCGSAP